MTETDFSDVDFDDDLEAFTTALAAALNDAIDRDISDRNICRVLMATINVITAPQCVHVKLSVVTALGRLLLGNGAVTDIDDHTAIIATVPVGGFGCLKNGGSHG